VKTLLSKKVLKSIFIGLVAFFLYTCIYALRKPFAVGKYSDIIFGHTTYKIILILSQVCGYTVSKFIGIRLIAASDSKARFKAIIACSIVAALALLGFAITPAPCGFVFLFLNGLPLGLMWGFIFLYLEGRTTTEIMAALLSSSFIFSSGFVKSVGAYLILNLNVNEMWMPFFTACIFLPFLILLAYVLNTSFARDAEDFQVKSERKPMDKEFRRSTLKNLLPFLVPIVILYMCTTAYRDFRDNFSIEIFEEIGAVVKPAIFTQTELYVSLLVLFIFSLLFKFKDNVKAFKLLNIFVLIGLSLMLFISLSFKSLLSIEPIYLVALQGLALYLIYFPFNSMYFDRFVALYKNNTNAGFFIYIVDSFGYLGSVLVLIFFEIFQTDASYYKFLILLGTVLSIIGIVAIASSYIYIRRLKLMS
jgi:MFS family permease